MSSGHARESTTSAAPGERTRVGIDAKQRAAEQEEDGGGAPCHIALDRYRGESSMTPGSTMSPISSEHEPAVPATMPSSVAPRDFEDAEARPEEPNTRRNRTAGQNLAVARTTEGHWRRSSPPRSRSRSLYRIQ